MRSEEIKLEKEGNYEIDNKVIVALVKKAFRRVKGICSIKKGLFGERIKVNQVGEGIRVSLELVAKEGTSIPQVVEETQREIKEEIEKTLSRTVEKVDVKIKGIKPSST